MELRMPLSGILSIILNIPPFHYSIGYQTTDTIPLG
jgi:hypothetical protein